MVRDYETEFHMMFLNENVICEFVEYCRHFPLMSATFRDHHRETPHIYMLNWLMYMPANLYLSIFSNSKKRGERGSRTLDHPERTCPQHKSY